MVGTDNVDKWILRAHMHTHDYFQRTRHHSCQADHAAPMYIFFVPVNKSRQGGKVLVVCWISSRIIQHCPQAGIHLPRVALCGPLRMKPQGIAAWASRTISDDQNPEGLQRNAESDSSLHHPCTPPPLYKLRQSPKLIWSLRLL